MQDLKVKDVLSTEFERIGEDDTISAALGKFKVSPHVLVVFNKSGKYSGILVEKDLTKIRPEADEKVKNHITKVSQVSLEDTLPKAVGVMLSSRVKHLPIFNGEKIIGMLTDESILNKLAESKLGGSKIKNYYTKEPFILESSDTIAKALTLFRKNNVSRAPVIEDGKVQGMITIHDILMKVNRPRSRQNMGAIATEKNSILDNSVKSIMSQNLITAEENESMHDVIAKMLEFEISGIPITDGDSIKGIITRTDLLEPVAAMSQEKQQRFFVSARGDLEKLDSFDRAQINDDLEKFAERYSDRFQESHMIVNFKEHKEKTRKQPYIYCKVKFSTDKGYFVGSDHDFGAKQSLHRALEHIERQINEIKEKKIKKRRD